MFGRFSAKLGPETPLGRRGSFCNAGCTNNQARRPVLRPFRGHVFVLPGSRLRGKQGQTYGRILDLSFLCLTGRALIQKPLRPGQGP